MLIDLTPEELKMCGEFSIECAKYQQKIEFGQSDTSPRDLGELARDILIGKLAEVAFAQLLKVNYGIEISLDFDFYPRGKWDKNDAEINGWQIDVKATRQGGKWFLIEWSKLYFRQKEGNLPDLFVVASIYWDRKEDIPTGMVKLVGCASLFRLNPSYHGTRILHKGDCIPNTRTKLQADNFAINFDDLEDDWDYIVDYITKNHPPDSSEYQSPYDVND